MKRVNYHLPEQVIEKLKAEAKRTGLTVAEIIRRAIDTYLEKRT
jgi:predicted DNA-binding protein